MVEKGTLKVTVLSKTGKVERVVTSQVGGSATATEGTGTRKGRFGSSRIFDIEEAERQQGRELSVEESRQKAEEASQQYEAEQVEARRIYDQIPKVQVSGSNVEEAYKIAAKKGFRISEQVGGDIFFYKGSREANTNDPSLVAQVVGERKKRAQFPSGEEYNQRRDQALVDAGTSGVGIIEDYGFPVQKKVSTQATAQNLAFEDEYNVSTELGPGIAKGRNIFVPLMSVEEGAGLYTPIERRGGVSGPVLVQRPEEEILREEFRKSATGRIARGYESFLSELGLEPSVESSDFVSENVISKAQNGESRGQRIKESIPVNQFSSRLFEDELLFKDFGQRKGLSARLEEEFVTRRQSQKQLFLSANQEDNKYLRALKITGAGAFALGSELVSPEGLAFAVAGGTAFKVLPSAAKLVSGAKAAKVTKAALGLGGVALGGQFAYGVYGEAIQFGASPGEAALYAAPSLALAGLGIREGLRETSPKSRAKSQKIEKLAAFSKEDIAQLDRDLRINVGKDTSVSLKDFRETLTKSEADVFLLSKQGKVKVLTGFKKIPRKTSGFGAEDVTLGILDQTRIRPVVQAVQKGEGRVKIRNLKKQPTTRIRGAFELIQEDDLVKGLIKTQAIKKLPKTYETRESVFASKSQKISDDEILSFLEGRTTARKLLKSRPKRFVDLERTYKVTPRDIDITRKSSRGVFRTKEIAEIREGDTSLKLLKQYGVLEFIKEKTPKARKKSIEQEAFEDIYKPRIEGKRTREERVSEIKDILKEQENTQKEIRNILNENKPQREIQKLERQNLESIKKQLNEAAVLRELEQPRVRTRKSTPRRINPLADLRVGQILGTEARTNQRGKQSATQALRDLLGQTQKSAASQELRRLLRQDQGTREILRTAQLTGLSTRSPPPIIPGVDVPIIPGFPVDLTGFGFGGRKRREGTSRRQSEQFYSPDFTSKALLLTTKRSKASDRFIRKTFTGFELRRIIV